MAVSTLHNQSIIVVGAGISGLATAWYLQQQGHKVQVLEASDRMGGNIQTVNYQDCIIETGPNSLVANRPLIQEMIKALNLTQALLPAKQAAKKRYIGKQGQLHALPSKPWQAFTTPLLSWQGKLRILAELFVKPDYQEQSIYTFTKNRLGQEAADWLIDPFVSGIFAGDPKSLSVSAALPRLWALVQDHGSLIKGGIAKGRIAKARQRKALNNNTESKTDSSNTASNIATFKKGLGQWIEALAAPLNITLACKIERLTNTATGYTLHSGTNQWQADQVVLAIPALQAAQLLDTLGAKNDVGVIKQSTIARLQEQLNSIDYPGVASVTMLFDRSDIDHPLDGFGALLPTLEQRQTLGVLFPSSMFTDRCPRDKHLLTAFIGGSRGEQAMLMSQGQRLDTILQDLTPYLGIKGEPLWCLDTCWPCAIPQYHLGHQTKQRHIQNLIHQLPGLHLCSNFMAGVALGDCIEQAHGLAQRISSAQHNSSVQHNS